MITTIIIDDQVQPREVIRKILTDKFPDIQIVAEADSVKTGIDAIKKYNPEFVILDVELGDGISFEILEKIRPIEFKFIFVTGYTDYAVQAFKFSALDYILKPVDSIEFEAAVRKVLNEIEKQNQDIKLQAFFANFQNIAKEDRKIVLKTSDSIHVVNIQNIVRCQSDNSYVTFFLNDGKKIMVTNTLKDYEDLFTPYGFFRTHQSHLVNINCIVRFDKRDGGFIVMTDNSNVPVSQRKRHELLEYFDKL